MFDYITGKITAKHPAHIVLEVGNNIGSIGYLIHIPLSTYNQIGKPGDPCRMLITPVVREDSWTLYGFATEEERTMFNLLTTVSGVGPKSAIAALSGMSVQQISSAIANADIDKLTLLPGVGKKTAQRIALELKDKIKTLDIGEIIPLNAEVEEAVMALEALGFSRYHAEKAVQKVVKSGAEQKADQIIREALAYLTGK